MAQLSFVFEIKQRAGGGPKGIRELNGPVCTVYIMLAQLQYLPNRFCREFSVNSVENISNLKYF